MKGLEQFPVSVPDGHHTRLQDPARLSTLSGVDLMDTEPEDVFDRAVRLATRVTGTPVGLLSLVDGERQFFKAHAGLTGPAALDGQTPLSHSFCQYVVTANEPLAVADAREHPMLHQNAAVPDMDVVAYLGIPVRAHDGQPLGSFCTIDHEPRDWTEGEMEALRDIAAIVESELELRRQIAQSELLARELHHRVKNLFALTSGMVNLTARESTTPDAMREALTGRLQALAHAHDLIRPAITNEKVDKREGDLDALLSAVLRPHTHGAPHRLSLSGPAVALGPKAATSLALVLHELATNAVKYGSLSNGHGILRVSWVRQDDDVVVRWTEADGPPVEQGGREGFGGRLVTMSVTGQLRGTIDSTPHRNGMEHRLTLPASVLGS